MRSTVRTFFLPSLLTLLALGPAGCDNGPYARDCPTTASCMDADTDIGLDLGPGYDIPAVDMPVLSHRLLSIEIVPHAFTLVVHGTPATEPYTLVGHFENGVTQNLRVGVWSTDTVVLGGIDRVTGLFTANGLVGGVANIAVDVVTDGGVTLHDTAVLTVQVATDTFVAPTTADAAAHFMAPAVTDAAHAVPVLYPLADAVMPQNVSPPDVQWDQGVAGDIYRVQLSKPHVVVNGYVTHTGAMFHYDWPVAPTSWRALAESDPAAPIQLTIDRWDGSRHIAGPPLTFRLANGSLAGAIYYWDLRAGKILRILDNATDGTARREDFIPHPPDPAAPDPVAGGAAPDPAAAAPDPMNLRHDPTHGRCIACHAISRDGRYMAAALFENQSFASVFDLTTDLSTNPVHTVFPDNVQRWVYASFDPTSTRLIASGIPSAVGGDNGPLRLINAATGAVVTPVAGTLPNDASNSVQPSWSPDGHTIAYVTNIEGPGPTAFHRGDLATLDVTGADSFGASRTIHQGSALAATDPLHGNADAYPSWSPDSRWLAFQHSVYSESDSERPATMPMAPRVPNHAAIYLIAPTGGTPVRLDRASVAPAGTMEDAFFPNFSPFVQSGSYWLVYFSRRDYGNAQAGTRGSSRRQLWVTAIDTAVTAGADPSHVPYWLPGQDTASDNMSAYWAPQACRPRGVACTVSSECCVGVCGPDHSTPPHLICNPPPATAPCRGVGDRCGASSDCCAGLSCAANVCLAPPG